MVNFKKPYEISIWDDVLTYVLEFPLADSENFLIKEVETLEGIEEGWRVRTQYYKEKKFAIIGSDNMTSATRAYNPILKRNVNGSYELSFVMNYVYYDEETEEYLDNPFMGALANERKIKFRRGKDEDAQWFDLIIKNTQKDSQNKTVTYLAKAQFINELSKTGFNIVLNSELENNTGTITQLAETILEGTDWKLAEDIEKIQQYLEEPVYELKTSQDIEAYKMDPENGETKVVIPRGATIYIFYSSIIKKEDQFQFLYTNEEYKEDENGVITNANNYYLADYSEADSLIAKATFSFDYRGNRLVKKQLTKFDPIANKYIGIYTDGQREIYGYTETKYISPAAVTNLVTNASEFVDTTGWVGGKGGMSTEAPVISVYTEPDAFDFTMSENQKYYSFLSFKFETVNDVIFNSGINDNRSTIRNLTEGNKYTLGIRCKDKKGISAKVCSYVLNDGIYHLGETFFDFDLSLATQIDTPNDENRKYKLYTVTTNCLKGMTYADLIKTKIGIFIYPTEENTTKQFLIEELQLYKYQEDAEGKPCIIDGDIKTGVKTIYYYYYPNPSASSMEELEVIYEEETPANYAKVYSANYEKIRSITASESNRFNLIQSLCEVFECWADFNIQHDPDGAISLKDYHPIKTISFREYIGKDNYAGFKYGINLKSIQRTVESESIVTKLVVKDNSNEFGEGGFCSIARAKQNPSGENFILNFDYFVNQGLLDENAIKADLYLTSEGQGYIGYIPKLRNLNNTEDVLIEEFSKITPVIDKYEAQYQTYKISVESAEEQLISRKEEIKVVSGYDWITLTNKELQTNDLNAAREREEVKKCANVISRLIATSENHSVLRDRAKENLDKEVARQEEIGAELKSIKEQKLKLNLQFYTKYSRFIQEGSWISEDYLDDDLYYLDAYSTGVTSSLPKLSYNINVIELSQIEDYENYNFDLGDKTYIEDFEFFGIKKEEVIVSEISEHFDAPEGNQIKVQNYKTQFEDLFQRITATTNSVQYSSGKYNKVSNVIETNGDIKVSALENSMINNSFVISNAKDESTVIDETGLTSTNLSDPSKVLRLVSGGLFLSKDGGLTWQTGITGSGINANYINTGRIDTSVINIMNGNYPSFRWDAHGINAYQFTVGEYDNVFNFNNFIRFDQYGIYGVKGYDSAEFMPAGSNDPDKYIKDRADFALTWKGFSIKSNHDSLNDEDSAGHISITPDNDLQVFDGALKERIKIGWLGSGNYGIRISDKAEEPILETRADGGLWLRKRLNITSEKNYSIGLGYLDKTDIFNRVDPDTKEEEEIELHRTIDVNSNFIVWEDGSILANNGNFKGHVEAESGTFNGTVYATSGSFTGEIYATGGKIGNMTINQLVASKLVYKIESSDGSILNNPGSDKKVTLTARIYNNGVEQDPNGLKEYHWFIKRDNEEVEELQEKTKTIQIFANSFNNKASIYFKVEEEENED